MKRNKKTVILAHEKLTPLTEHILAKMGKEGTLIRMRLKSFHRDRASLKEPPFDQPLEAHGFEAANRGKNLLFPGRLPGSRSDKPGQSLDSVKSRLEGLGVNLATAGLISCQ